MQPALSVAGSARIPTGNVFHRLDQHRQP
jgi:hypothetical protein